LKFLIFTIRKYGFQAVLLLFAATALFSQNIETENSSKKSFSEYSEELVERAKKQHLSKDMYWHALLHYRKGFFGYESLVDDPKFFFSKKGKTDPESEIEETIRAFFRKPVKGEIHPTAKFCGRFAWLREKLNIDVDKLSYNGEENFQKFYKELAPEKIVLVFPAGYMNSPASMYGHTLLIMENSKKGRLLAKAANYAAITDETFGPTFAFKGLLGLYRGYYSYLPYYKKIKEYSDGEMRDMWEYELNLTPKEIERLVRHVVEMEDIYSDYYFIDENCSFNLLYLILAARPETQITEQFRKSVEPIDTLRAANRLGLVKRKVYRPSLYAKIQHLKDKLTWSEQSFVKDVCSGDKDISELDKSGLSNEKKAVICDLVVEFLKFQAVKGDIEGGLYRTVLVSTLRKRSTLEKAHNLKDIEEPVSPDLSHRPSRISVSHGMKDDEQYTSLAFRTSSHHLMDPDEGLNTNSQIVFLNFEGRYYYDEKEFKLQRFDILDLTSLPPSDRFYFSACWDFKTGFVQHTLMDQENLTYYAKAATGLSTKFFDVTQGYFFAGFETYFNGNYTNNTDYLLGGEAGIITSLSILKNRLYSSIFYSPQEYKRSEMKLGAELTIKMTSRFSLMAGYTYNRIFFKESNLEDPDPCHSVELRINSYI